MGAKKKLRVEDQAPDQEDPETQLSDAEGEEDPTAPETDTDMVPAEELTNEDLLRGAWQGSLVTEEHIKFSLFFQALNRSAIFLRAHALTYFSIASFRLFISS